MNLASLPVQRLAEIWCEMNRWKVPSELRDVPGLESERWRSPKGGPISATKGMKIMHNIESLIADKIVSREWNRDMSDEQFEAFYARSHVVDYTLPMKGGEA